MPRSRGTTADPKSIMCYQIPGEITKDGKPIVGGRTSTRPTMRSAPASIRQGAGRQEEACRQEGQEIGRYWTVRSAALAGSDPSPTALQRHLDSRSAHYQGAGRGLRKAHQDPGRLANPRATSWRRFALPVSTNRTPGSVHPDPVTVDTDTRPDPSTPGGRSNTSSIQAADAQLSRRARRNQRSCRVVP